jgi:hypothetical protein
MQRNCVKGDFNPFSQPAAHPVLLPQVCRGMIPGSQDYFNYQMVFGKTFLLQYIFKGREKNLFIRCGVEFLQPSFYVPHIHIQIF